MSTRQDLVIDLATDWSADIPLFDADGNPANLTGYVFQMQIRPSATSNVLIVAPTVTLGTGKVTASLALADTDSITDRSGWYSIRATDPDGKVTRPVEGAVIFTPETTR